MARAERTTLELEAAIGPLRRLDAVLDHVGEAITVQDATGRVVYANRAALALIGVPTLDELLAMSPDALMTGFELLDDRGGEFPIERLPGRVVLAGGAPETATVRFRRRTTGEDRYSAVSAEAIHHDGQLVGVVNTFRDVTQLRRDTIALEVLVDVSGVLTASVDHREMLRAVARLTAPRLADWCLIDVVDDDGTPERVVVWHEDPGRRAMGADLALVMPLAIPKGTPPTGSVTGATASAPPHDSLAMVGAIDDDRLRDAASGDVGRLRRLRSLALSGYLTVPLPARDRLIGALSLVSAESRRRLGEQDLAIAHVVARRLGMAVENLSLYRRAEQAIRGRDAFLGMAAHELLTPIAVVRGYSQALERLVAKRRLESPPAGAPTLSIEEERLASAVKRVDAAADGLSRLIGDLLDVSRIQRGRFEVQPRRVDLVQLSREAAESIGVRQSGGQYPESVSLVAELPTEPIWGEWDPMRLEQVLLNLLDNALKYSRPGGQVRLDVWRDEDEACARVTDDGIGIAPDQLELIFEPFNRATDAEREGYPGFGMGLAICREIVERHGGRIWASSQGPGTGTRLDILLPISGGTEVQRE